MKIKTNMTLEFVAPDGTEAWDLAQQIIAIIVHRLGVKECFDIKPNIVSVTADGKAVHFKPRRPSR